MRPLMACAGMAPFSARDRKSTRLNSSHSQISYAVFCLKKKKSGKAPTDPRVPQTQTEHLVRARHDRGPVYAYNESATQMQKLTLDENLDHCPQSVRGP